MNMESLSSCARAASGLWLSLLLGRFGVQAHLGMPTWSSMWMR